jgi:hypothetical protein
MNRGLIFGAIAFVAAYAAEQLISSMGKDIAKYNEMRKMSGQEPIAKELLTIAGSFFGNSGAAGFITDTTNDIVRYAKMKGM